MAAKISSPIHKRVISTSIGIILVFSIAVGVLLNQLYVQNYSALYAADLVSAVPDIIRELRQDKPLKRKDTFIEAQNAATNPHYLSFICSKEQDIIWMSSEAKKARLDDICRHIPADIPELDLVYYQESPYAVHTISGATHGIEEHFFVLRNVENQVEKFATLKRKTWFYVALLFVGATGLLYAASYWSFSPLRKLAGELNEIAESRREKLDEDYPPELEDVTDALNRMITLRKAQTQRYRHAMDDLAHSLKSRLAATNALLDDGTLERDMMSKRIIEQVSQMDDMVQYQLKRALLGQQGLMRESTLLQPQVDSLTGMFIKIYGDKPVDVSTDFKGLSSLPLNKADLTELLGNLLENAFRYCISQVRIRSEETPDSYLLIIEDDGPGVPVTYRDSIFQRGVRADQLNPGTGIGLAVCDDIVQSYEGSISVVASDLEGAAFIMRFPKHR
ncbi:ATP-binding protein [Enterovibrio makurazakiensis]|uniref:histidine kinase n=1 Tax=Enterovibrio gelatinilyticus TaxID=2899819 RepID=A0ABT5R3Z7_9GAMM|nr:ATP-binding protein [Enterovibrio sp. ZSDZ42]MDD1794973.1 ATP-binding protein [Enterovibrio sp. ZSDZ42]